MRDYTYKDMLRMQEDAANRVREMKKRAILAVEEEQPTQKMSLPDEVRHISYPVELPVQQNVEQNSQNDRHGNGLIDFLTKDKDALLILSLLMVLNSNAECDRVISVALLYLLF